MGVSNPVLYNGRYQGTLSDDSAKKLDFILESFDPNQPIEGLEDLIYDCTSDEVEIAIGTQKPVPNPAKGKLRPYQTLGVVFCYYSERCLLGDSVGLGKTIQIAGLANLIYKSTHRQPRVLFFCEKKSLYQLQRELTRFSGQPYLAIQGVKDDIEALTTKFRPNKCPNLVVSHSAIANPQFQSWVMEGNQLDAFDLVVVDESSILGNTTTQVYQNCKKLFDKSPRLVLLNATSFESHLDVFYNQLNLLDNKLLPTKSKFDRRYKIFDYRGFYPKPTGKYQHAEEFRRLVSLRYFSRQRKELGGSFENCSATTVVSPLLDVQRKMLSDTTLHQQVFNCPWVLDDRIASCPKIDSLVETVNTRIPADEQVLIYCHYLAAQDKVVQALEELGLTVGVLNGSTPQADIDLIIKGFQEGVYQVLVTNIQKSLNFGNCNYCVFYGYNPNPNKMIQFEGRMTRSFDIRNKHLFVLLSEGKEYDTFFGTIKHRAEASSSFAGSDHSLLMMLLASEGES